MTEHRCDACGDTGCKRRIRYHDDGEACRFPCPVCAGTGLAAETIPCPCCGAPAECPCLIFDFEGYSNDTGPWSEKRCTYHRSRA